MPDMILELRLVSDATLGRGDGIAGEVDAEVQHDQYGFPYLGGRTLKGLLVQECADILAAISDQERQRWQDAAAYLFGRAGSTTADSGHLIVGDAMLPEGLRQWVRQDIEDRKLGRQDVLESLTAIRWQTAIDSETGVPKAHSLRSMRVVLRETLFRADIFFDESPVDDMLQSDARKLLAACAASLRRIGTGRNRGRGLVKTKLLDGGGKELPVDAFFQEATI